MLLGALIFFVVAVLVGAGFAWQGLDGDASSDTPARTAPAGRTGGPESAAQSSPTGAPDRLPTGPTTVRSVSGSLCLAPGDRATVIECGDGSEVRWTLTALPDAPDRYLIVSTANDRCLDVIGGSNDDGAAILVYQCHRGQNQHWRVRPAGDGQVELVGASSGKCLDVPAESGQPGTQLQQWTCLGRPNQRWVFSP